MDKVNGQAQTIKGLKAAHRVDREVRKVDQEEDLHKEDREVHHKEHLQELKIKRLSL